MSVPKGKEGVYLNRQGMMVKADSDTEEFSFLVGLEDGDKVALDGCFGHISVVATGLVKIVFKDKRRNSQAINKKTYNHMSLLDTVYLRRVE